MTGWRIGFAAGPAELMTGLLRIHQYTVMCASDHGPVGGGEPGCEKAKSTSRRWWRNTTGGAS